MEIDYSGRNMGIRKLVRINIEDKGVHDKTRAIKKDKDILLLHYL